MAARVAFAGQRRFQLGGGREHGQAEPSSRRCGVDGRVQAHETGAELAYELERVLNAAGQPIQARDRHGVGLADVDEPDSRDQAGTLGPESVALVGTTPSAAALLEDLRTHIGMNTALRLPPGPNSGLSVHL